MANNRSIFIINPKFQYKFCFIICSFVFIGSLIYPVTIYDLFEGIIALQPDDASRYQGKRDKLLLLLGITQVAFIGIVFVLCIFLSHKIAGPMYKLTLYLQELRTGGSKYKLTFRDGDQFTEVADEINDTIEFLQAKSDAEIEYLQEVSAYIENLALIVPEDKKPVLNEIQAKLSDFQGLRRRED